MSDDEENDTEVKNIRVFVRILPLLEVCESCVKIGAEDKAIYVRCLQDLKQDRIVKSDGPMYWRFSTDGVFLNASQAEVSEGVLRGLMSNVLDGANGVIVSCGQTGTGKSFTVGGLRNNWEHRGLIARLLSDMFEERWTRRHVSRIHYALSYVELYGNQIKDLLIPEDKQCAGNSRDPFKSITSVAVVNEEETLRKIFEGEARRMIQKGRTYNASHQGTGVVTFHVANTSLISSWAVVATSKVHIVDMAGIDTIGKPNCLKTATDVGKANLAKTQLEQFFIHLGAIDNLQSNPITRTSSLLKYLGNALGISSVLRFIAHVRVTREDLEFTLSTMRFSSRIKKLKPTRVSYGIEPQTTLEIQKLQEEVNSLKRELDVNDMFFHQEALMNISNLRAEQIRQDAVDFLGGTLCDLTMLSVSQAQVLLKTFKELYNKLEVEKDQAVKNAAIEAYENAVNNLRLSATMSAARIPKVFPPVPSLISTTNRKGRKSADRNSTRMSVQSQAEDKLKEKVGDVNKSGITIGPGRPGTADSALVKAMKIAKAGVGSKSSLVTSLEGLGSARPSSQLPASIPKREEAFDRFINEVDKASQLRRDFDERVGALSEVQKDFMEINKRHSQLKTELESSRIELLKQQNIRHVTGDEVYDTEGRILIPESEKTLVNVVNGLEIELGALQSEVIHARETLKSMVNDQLDAGYKLESAFQAFCERTYRQAVPKLEEEPKVESGVEPRNRIDEMRDKFSCMQEMMETMIKNKPETKKRFDNYPLMSRRQ